jgi:hypothetical protein
MSSVLGYIQVDPEDLDDEELAEALSRVELDHQEAEGWEQEYASEVDRLKTLWNDIQAEADARGGLLE